jgi:hypothetical protein
MNPNSLRKTKVKPLTLTSWIIDSLCHKTNVPSEVTNDDFIDVDSDIIVTEVTGIGIIQEILGKRGGNDEANSDGNDAI